MNAAVKNEKKDKLILQVELVQRQWTQGVWDFDLGKYK